MHDEEKPSDASAIGDGAVAKQSGEAPKTSQTTLAAHDDSRSSKDTSAPLNIAKNGDDGLTVVSMVGNLSNPNTSGAHHHLNASGLNASHRWPLWLQVAQDRGSSILHDVTYRAQKAVLSILIANHWIQDSANDDSEASFVNLVCLGICIAAVLFVTLWCVHRLATRLVQAEESEDSSMAWYGTFDNSSPCTSPNRHPWFFIALGFSWRSKFAAQPMPSYSAKHRHFIPGA